MALMRSLLLFLLLLSGLAEAAVPAWNILPEQSSLTFTGTLNNAPTSGQFHSFQGDIHFDPQDLKHSQVKITVDTGSVTTSYADIAATLKTPDWLSVKVFPQAVFEAAQFVKTGNQTFEAEGRLTIRGKTLPATLRFSAEEQGADRVQVSGETTLKRNQFGIGQGEWAATDAVQDEVKVQFKVTAVKSAQ